MGGGMSGNKGSLERQVSAPCLTSVWQAGLSQGSSHSRERQLSCQLGLNQGLVMWLISLFGVAAGELKPSPVSRKPRQASAPKPTCHLLCSRLP